MPLTSPKHVSRMLTSGQETVIDEVFMIAHPLILISLNYLKLNSL